MRGRGLTVQIPSSLFQEITRARRLFSYDHKHPASMAVTITTLLESVGGTGRGAVVSEENSERAEKRGVAS